MWAYKFLFQLKQRTAKEKAKTFLVGETAWKFYKIFCMLFYVKYTMCSGTEGSLVH